MPGVQEELRILLVEDNPDHARLTRSTLLRRNPRISVDVVNSSEAALERLSRPGIDLVFVDYSLPGRTGLDLIQELKDRGLGVPMVMVTGEGSEKVAVEALKAGAYDYVIKDESYWSILPTIVESVWNRYSREQQIRQLQEEVMRRNQELEDINQKLVAMQRHLIQSEKMAALAIVVRGLSHELNNPLTGILGYAQLLLEASPPADPRRDDLVEIERCAKRCKDIIAKLARFARQDGFPESSLDLNDLIQETLSLLDFQFNRSGIRVTRMLATPAPQVPGSALDLQQALLAVLVNAIQAMERGGTLTVISRVEGGQAHVSVTDTGPGIPEKDLPRVFTPFYTTREVGQGLGLGLSVCYGILQDHGGTIHMESQAGKGTTVHIALPLASEAPLSRESPP